MKGHSERGVALLLVIFVLTLGSLLVFELSRDSFYDQKASRGYSEGVQADYALKSALSLARAVIELPPEEGIAQDWLNEPWALISDLAAFPIEGLAAEAKIAIVDDNSLINLNALSFPISSTGGSPLVGRDNTSLFWIKAASELFSQLNFGEAKYKEEEGRTLGHESYNAADQAAVIRDWLDTDKQSFNAEGFDGEGLESGANKEWFFNRQFLSLAELPFVPGITPRRASIVSKYVTARSIDNVRQVKINVNTAPYEVLVAMGLSETVASELLSVRSSFPITTGDLNTLLVDFPNIRSKMDVLSDFYTVYVRVDLPNTKRWLKALVSANGRSRKTTGIISFEFY